MAFAGEQTGGRVQTDPAGAREIDLGPGVQVGEVGGGAFRAGQGLHVRRKLDQVPGDEARGQAKMAHDLHQQPGGIPAGSLALAQCLIGRPDARLHADDV